MTPVGTGTHRLLGLDVLRGIAIAMVIVGHNATWPSFRPDVYEALVSVNNVGYLGVDLFFALSGFLIGTLLISEFRTHGRINVGRFIVRRAFKIWPVLYAYLVTYVAVLWLQGTPLAAIMSDVWPSFLHVQNFFPTESGHGHLWTLGLEEQFYLLLPLFLSWHLPRINSAGTTSIRSLMLPLILLSAGLFVIRGLLPVESESLRTIAGAFRMDALHAGVVVALLVHYATGVTDAIKRHRHWLPLVALASLAPVFWQGGDELSLYPVRYPLLWFGFSALTLYAYFLEFNPPKLHRHVVRVGRPVLLALGWLGVHSYSIYVWHGYFAKPLAHRICVLLGLDPTHRLLGPLNELIFLAAPVVIGVVMYQFVERPMLTVRNRLFPSRATARVPI